jgi:hypothetical protein
MPELFGHVRGAFTGAEVDRVGALSFGIGSPAEALPQEALSCAPTTVTACTSSASCPSGSTCDRGWCQPAISTS